MSYDRTGQSVTGMYLGEYCIVGTVTGSRVKYGGKVQHQVRLVRPLDLHNSLRDTLLLDEEELILAGGS